MQGREHVLDYVTKYTVPQQYPASATPANESFGVAVKIDTGKESVEF